MTFNSTAEAILSPAVSEPVAPSAIVVETAGSSCWVMLTVPCSPGEASPSSEPTAIESESERQLVYWFS